MFILEPDQVESEAARAAGWLRAQGLVPGDRIAVVASNHPGFLPLTYGALRTGILPVLVNTHLTAGERDRILRDARPSLTLTDERWPDLSEADPVELLALPAGRPMHYTSGTTGTSKGVWGGVLTADLAAELARDERELWAFEPGDTCLVVSPLYHSAPHRTAVSALMAGARVMVAERFDASEIAEAYSTGAVTGGFLVPTHLRRLLAHGFSAPAARRVCHAGEPCPPELKERALEAFPEGTLWEFYGSTEGQFTAIGPAAWRDRPGSVGAARAGRRLRVTDAGADGVGQVWATCPEPWRWEYWGSPERTAAAWDGEWFTVGDLGRLDAEGYLWLAARREDLIITGGVNVYPAEVERVLEEHPLVGDVAVFGREDPEWGQRVCAAVVPCGVVDEADLLAWARERLGGVHVPKELTFVAELPRTATGKVRRTELAGGTARTANP